MLAIRLESSRTVTLSFVSSNHVSYRCPRSTHQPIHRRYDDRCSTEKRPAYRSTVNRKSTASLSLETITSQSRKFHRYILFHRHIMDTRSTFCRSPNDISHRHSKLFPRDQPLNVKYCLRENDSCVTCAKSCSKLCKFYSNTESL